MNLPPSERERLRRRLAMLSLRCRWLHWRRSKLVDGRCASCHLKAMAARVAAIGTPIVIRHLRDGGAA